jgi:hypothetical protein
LYHQEAILLCANYINVHQCNSNDSVDTLFEMMLSTSSPASTNNFLFVDTEPPVTLLLVPSSEKEFGALLSSRLQDLLIDTRRERKLKKLKT